jgi:hypothetical protein
MKKLLLCFPLIGLLSCSKPDQIVTSGGQISGRYNVWAYIVSGDTLFRLHNDGYGGPASLKPAINKIGIDNFNILVENIGGQVIVSTSYWRNGLRSTFSKEATVNHTDYQYQLSPIKTFSPSAYEGRVGRFTRDFYERTIGQGALVIPVMDSSTTPSPSSSQEVIILARPQR